MKHNSPQLGFNNNVRHKGRVFHIQTEDSGLKHPHIITHLFADGGRILKSTKTSYAEFVGEEELTKKVRGLMQEQHKAMFIALRAGKFDHLVGDAPAAEGAADATGPPTRSNGVASLDGSGEFAAAPTSLAIPSTTGVPVSSGRAPMASLTGATEFARGDVPPPPASNPGEASRQVARNAEAPPAMAFAETVSIAKVADPVPATLSDPLRDTGAQKAIDFVRTEARTERSVDRTRPTPPPRQEAQPVTKSEPTLSPLRALASRQTPPGNFPAAQAPSPPATAAKSSSATGMARLERPGSRAPSIPPPMPVSAGTPPMMPSPRPPLSASLDLDLAALERAAEQSQAPVYQQIRNLPPPPSSLLRPLTPRNTSYRSVTPQATQIVDPRTATNAPPPANAPAPPAAAPRTPLANAPRPPASSRGNSRYAPSRPASIFGNSRPTEGSSIFGEDLISEKSLDEVILSYLAEDLEGAGPNGKK